MTIAKEVKIIGMIPAYVLNGEPSVTPLTQTLAGFVDCESHNGDREK